MRGAVRREWAWGIGLVVVALALRLYRLDAQSLWLDEGSTWQLIGLPWAWQFTDLFNSAAAYPLYHVLLKAWVALFGASEFALRLPSALAGAAAVGAIYWAGREFEYGLGERKAGITLS